MRATTKQFISDEVLELNFKQKKCIFCIISLKKCTCIWKVIPSCREVDEIEIASKSQNKGSI